MFILTDGIIILRVMNVRQSGVFRAHCQNIKKIYEKNKKEDTDALLAELEALRAEKAEKGNATVGVANNDSTES